jgi:hypothetical protein
MKQVNLFNLSLLLLSTTLFSGCGVTYWNLNSNTPQYVTSVNSFGNYNLIGKTFYIESGDNSVSSNDVEFREYAGHVTESLRLSGATETNDKKNADLCILVNYGISDESYVATIPIPVWGQTGISSIRTTSQTTGSAYGSAYGSGNTVYGSAQASAYGNSTTNTTTNVTPSYGITGYTSVDRKISQFRRVLNIYAYDNKQPSNPTMLWKTNLVSDGSSSDLRKIVPIMAYCAWGRMGKSNGEWEKLSVYENSYHFKMYKDGQISKPFITSFPKCNSTNAENHMQIAFVMKYSDATIVTLQKTGCISWYSIAPTTYIEYNGQKLLVKSADNIKLGEKISGECGTRYINLRFPPIPANVTTINISEGDDVKNGWKWTGVKIK